MGAGRQEETTLAARGPHPSVSNGDDPGRVERSGSSIVRIGNGHRHTGRRGSSPTRRESTLSLASSRGGEEGGSTRKGVIAKKRLSTIGRDGFSAAAALDLAKQLNAELATDGVQAAVQGSPYLQELRDGTDAALRFKAWRIELEFLHSYLHGTAARMRTVAIVGLALAAAWPLYLAWRSSHLTATDIWPRRGACAALLAIAAAAAGSFATVRSGRAWLRHNSSFVAGVILGPLFLAYYSAYVASRLVEPDGGSEADFPAMSPFLLLALLTLRVPLRIASYFIVAVLVIEMVVLLVGPSAALGVLYWLALAEITGLLFVTAQGSEASSRRSFLLGATVARARTKAAQQARRLEALLSNVLPSDVLSALRKNELGRVNRRHDGASVVFVKLANIPSPTAAEAPRLISRINRVMGELEDLCVAHRVQKIKSIGANTFLAAGGVGSDGRATPGAAPGNPFLEPATNGVRFGLAAITAG
eukprot:tig00021580_g22592.t1